MTTQATETITTKRTNPSNRDAFHRTYGIGLSVYLEQSLYQNMDRFCPTYGGGSWQNLVGTNGAVARVLDKDSDMPVTNAGNYFEGTMSAEAASLAVFILTVNEVCMALHGAGNERGASSMADRYHALTAMAYDHPEAAKIIAFLD